MPRASWLRRWREAFASEAALNALRADALNALDAVAVSLERRTLTQEVIVTARQAVAAVLDQLPA